MVTPKAPCLLLRLNKQEACSHWSLPLIKVESHFSDEQDRKLLSLYETYVERALRLKG